MLIRQTLLYMPAQLLGPTFQFIAAVAWTHWLSADSYGVLAYVLASHELVYTTCLSWWSQYTLRFAGTFRSDADKARFQATENIVLLVGIPAQTGMMIFMLAAQHVNPTIEMVSFATLCCVSRSITMHLCERARAAGRIALYTVGQSIGPCAGFVVALLLVRTIDASPEMALAGFAIAQFVAVPWLWRGLGLQIRQARPDRSIFAAALLFGLPLILAGGVMWFSANGVRMIVERMNGAASVGLLSVGWGLGQRLASVVAMLVTAAAFPLAVRRLVDGSREDALRQLALGGAILFGLVTPATVGIMLVTRPMVELMISSPFRQATIFILPIAALTGGVRNLRIHFCDQVFILFEQTRLTIVINLVEVAATLGFCYLGAMHAGLAGAVLGCLAGAVIGAFFAFGLGIARFGLMIPWEHAGRISAATAVMASVLMMPGLGEIRLPPAPTLAIDIVVAVAVYFASLAALYPAQIGLLFTRARAWGLPYSQT